MEKKKKTTTIEYKNFNQQKKINNQQKFSKIYNLIYSIPKFISSSIISPNLFLTKQLADRDLISELMNGK